MSWVDGFISAVPGVRLPLAPTIGLTRESLATAAGCVGCADSSGPEAGSPTARPRITGASFIDGVRAIFTSDSPVQTTPPGRLSSPSPSPVVAPSAVREPLHPAQYTITPLYPDSQVTTTPRPPDAALGASLAPEPERTVVVTPLMARDKRKASARQVATFAIVLLAIAAVIRR